MNVIAEMKLIQYTTSLLKIQRTVRWPMTRITVNQIYYMMNSWLKKYSD